MISIVFDFTYFDSKLANYYTYGSNQMSVDKAVDKFVGFRTYFVLLFHGCKRNLMALTSNTLKIKV